MYKTIRHGENSLQYTILPQNDDFRLEGKIKASGAGAGAGSSSNKKNKVKKPKRRSFFAYLGLLFVCTVIIGAVLVPFLVSAECLPNPTEWFLKTKAAFTKGSVPDIKENMSGHPNTQGSNIINKGNLALAAINVGKTVKIINKDGVEKIIIKVNKTSNTAGNNNDTTLLNSPTVNTSMISLESNSVIKQIDSKTETSENEQKITITHLNMASAAADHQIETTQSTIVLENETTIKSVLPATIQETLVAATTTTTTTTITPLLNRLLTSASVPNVPRASLQSSLNQNSSNSSTQPTITTRIMQVPLLKSTAKKPAMPPVLVKNLAPIQTTPDTSNLNDILPVNTAVKEMKKDNVNSDWIHSHWPYIDPSTYFQWNGYKTEDSVLLPALLGFALIGVILIITVCLVARNKRTIVTSVRKRNRNDIEETGAEDNTTLLTNSNLSDED